MMAAPWASLMGSSCWPFGALVVGVKMGSGQPAGLREPGGEPDAADLAGLLVGRPAAADEVAAGDALDGEGL
jgi:hypothetical protein